MRIRAFVAVALGVIAQSAGAAAVEPRPQLKDVSSVRIANYGTPSTVIKDREQVHAIVEELKQLRNKTWRRVDAKISCYATLVLLSGTKTVALFRVAPDLIVERPQDKGQSSYSIEINQADLPRINTLLTGIPPAKGCAP